MSINEYVNLKVNALIYNEIDNGVYIVSTEFSKEVVDKFSSKNRKNLPGFLKGGLNLNDYFDTTKQCVLNVSAIGDYNRVTDITPVDIRMKILQKRVFDLENHVYKLMSPSLDQLIIMHQSDNKKNVKITKDNVVTKNKK